MHGFSHTTHKLTLTSPVTADLTHQTPKFVNTTLNVNNIPAMLLAGVKSGGPAYALEANPAYTQGAMGVAPGYPQQGPVAVGPGYPQQGYVPGGVPAYPVGPDNQRNFSGQSPHALLLKRVIPTQFACSDEVILFW